MKLLLEKWQKFINEQTPQGVFVPHKHGRHESDIYIPPSTDLSKPVKIITYHHGFGSSRNKLRNMIQNRKYNKNVIIATPLYTRHSRDGGKGKARAILAPGYIKNVMDTVQNKTGQPINLERVRSIAHSAGGPSMRRWAKTEDPNLPHSSFDFLDASYGRDPKRLKHLTDLVGQGNLRFVTGGIPSSKTRINVEKYKKSYPEIKHYSANPEEYTHDDISRKWDWDFSSETTIDEPETNTEKI